MNGLDLSGKIIFKVKLDKEIKKIIIHNDEINYNELLLMIQRIFTEKIKPNDEFVIKYTDEENDMITIANDSDVSIALQNSKILKLTIFLDEKEENVEEIKASEIVRELQHIRSGIDKFLEKFDRYLKLDKNYQKAEELSKNTHEVKLTSSSTVINNDLHKEFDPLAKSNSLEANATIGTTAQKFLPVQKNSRAATPDSIGSSEFSPNPKTKYPAAQQTEINQQHQQQAAYMQLNNPNIHQDSSHVHQQQQYNQSLQQQQQKVQPHQPQASVQQPGQSQYLPQSTSYGNQQQMLQQQQQYMPQQIQANLQNTQPMGIQQQLQNTQLDSQNQNLYQAQAQQQQYYQHPGLAGAAQQAAVNPSVAPQQQQQQQQPQHPGMVAMAPGLPNQQQQQTPTQQPTVGFPPYPSMPSATNPYSQKTPGIALARPPSASLYQQGYK